METTSRKRNEDGEGPSINTLLKALSDKQKLFVRAYIGLAKGNATEAARIAGYKSASASAYETMRNPKVLNALDAIQTADPLIASPTDRMKLLTRIIRDEQTSNRDRLTAMQQLSKMTGDFVHRVKAEGEIALTFTDLIDIAEREGD